MPSWPPPTGITVEVKCLRMYPGSGPGERRQAGHGYRETVSARIGTKRPRVYCLLRWGNQQSRSQTAILSQDAWWCSSQDVHRVEWASTVKASADKTMTVELFNAGSGDEEEDGEGDSLYDFRLSSIGSFRVTIEPHATDEWYPCHSSDGSVLWGLFARVAVRPWVDSGEGAGNGEAEGMGSQQPEEGKEPGSPMPIGASAKLEAPSVFMDADAWPTGSASSLVEDYSSASPSSPPAAAAEGPCPPRLTDPLGFAVEGQAEEEVAHLQSLARLRVMEQQLRWDRHRMTWAVGLGEEAGGGGDGTRTPLPFIAGAAGSPPSSPLHTPTSPTRAASPSTLGGRRVPRRSPRVSRGGLSGRGSGPGDEVPCLSDVEAEDRVALLRALVWDGVPQPVRREAYQAICAAARHGQEGTPGPDYYLRLVAQTQGPSLGIVGVAPEEEAGGWVCVNTNREGVEGRVGDGANDWDTMPEISEAWGTTVAQEIELDIGRAFSGSETLLCTEGGRASLRRVLRAYALRNPVIGYCQGMNFIAGLLLLVTDEETAFSVLCHMCEEVNPLCYSPRMLGTKADMQALEEILHDEVPVLYRHCASMHLLLELWAAQWFLVYFINVFPPFTALRIIEVAMTEGSDIVFAVAVAFLRLIEPELLACDDLSLLLDTLKARQATMYDVDLLLLYTRKDLQRIRSRLRTLRAWHLSEVMRREPEPGTGTRSGSLGRANSTALYREGEERRIRRMLTRSLALGRRLLGLTTLWDKSGRARSMIDRRAFDLTHRYLVERKVMGSITPYLVGVLRWLMRWPIVSRRTGELMGSGPSGRTRAGRSIED